jgi:hypothetical protein
MFKTIIWPHGGSRVQLAGTWNDWEPVDMDFDKATGYHTSRIQVIPRETYQYKFVVDGNWCLDADMDSATSADGHQNHEILGEDLVIEEKIDLPAYDPMITRPALKTPQIIMETHTPKPVEEGHFTEWITPDDNEPSESTERHAKVSEGVDELQSDNESGPWTDTPHEEPDEKIDDMLRPLPVTHALDKIVKKSSLLNWSLAGGLVVAMVAVTIYAMRQHGMISSIDGNVFFR